MPHVIDKKEAKGKCKGYGFYVCGFPQKKLLVEGLLRNDDVC